MEKMVKHNKNTSVYAGKRDYGILALFVATLAVGLFIGFAFTSISDSCTTGQYLWPNIPKTEGGYGAGTDTYYDFCVCRSTGRHGHDCLRSTNKLKAYCTTGDFECSEPLDCR